MIKETTRMTGTVKWYDQKKGFGFITPDIKGNDVFLHHTALKSDNSNRFIPGERISFTIQNQEKGIAGLEVERFQDPKESPQRPAENYNFKFKELDLCPEILRAVSDLGYKTPTPIQAQTIPTILEGQDLLGCAQTGTGKTAAFALPILQRLSNPNKKRHSRHIKALVLSPTRELAIQIENNFNLLGKYTSLKTTVIYGGVGQNPQVKALQSGVDIVVATPGRLLDLERQGHLDLSHIEIFVLDEGDRMLDMGFIHDIRSIIEIIPKENRQTLLFSATIPREIKLLSNTILRNPLEFTISPENPTLESINQGAFFISKTKKQILLEQILSDHTITKALVFTRTKHGANRIVKNLTKKRILADVIHGNKSQTARQAALKSFRIGKIRVLVATDVASRGIDVIDISHVIQFDLPDVPETYVHRIGRTARAGAKGTAFLFCEYEQKKELREIEKFIQMRINIIKNPCLS